MDFRQLLRQERRRAREAAKPAATEESTAPETADPEEEPCVAGVSEEWLRRPLDVWAKRSTVDLEQFRKGPIPGVYYLPEWLSPQEEDAILERVYSIPDSNEHVWVKLHRRRLQMWGGEVKVPFHAKPLPEWLTQISHALVDAGIFQQDKTPNHALINEYGVGDGILPHEDGPSYFPLVAILSTGAACCVTYEPHRARASTENQPADASYGSEVVPHLSFQLARRSLLLFTGEAYTRYLHSIDEVAGGTRISLTMRYVALS